MVLTKQRYFKVIHSGNVVVFHGKPKTWKLIDAEGKLYLYFEPNAYSDVLEIPITAMIIDVLACASRKHDERTKGRDYPAIPLWRNSQKEKEATNEQVR